MSKPIHSGDEAEQMAREMWKLLERSPSDPLLTVLGDAIRRYGQDCVSEASAKISRKDGKMIAPTVGRVVWFWPPKDNAVFYAIGDGQPLAALVAHVWSDTCINLAIFDANGKPVDNPPTSVLLLQDGNPRPTGGAFCEWMPYQKGQAAKTEALEAVVRGTSGTAQGVGMAV